MKNQIKKFANFSLGPILSGAIMAVIIPLTTYFLSPSEYGKASMFTILQGLIASIAYFGFDQAFTREYNSIKDKKKLFMNSIIIPIAIFFLMFLISLFGLRNISSWIYPDGSYILLVVGFELLIISTIFERFILMYIRMKEDGKRYSFYTTLIKIFVLIFTIAFILSGSRTFQLIIWSTIFGQICADIILIYQYRFLFSIHFYSWFDYKLIKRMLLFGIPIVISVSITNLLQMSDRIFLNTYGSYHELGIYTAALKIMAIMSIIQTIFVNYWVPISYRWLNEGRKTIYFQLVSELINMILANIIFIIAICGPIITLFLSNRYDDVQYYIPLLAFSIYMSCLSETTNLGIVFSRKTYFNVYVTGITLIVNVGLSFIVIPTYGTRGAALSNALSFMLFLILRTLLSSREGFRIKMSSHLVTISYVFIVCVVKAFLNLSSVETILFYVPFFVWTLFNLKNIYQSFVKLTIKSYT